MTFSVNRVFLLIFSIILCLGEGVSFRGSRVYIRNHFNWSDHKRQIPQWNPDPKTISGSLNILSGTRNFVESLITKFSIFISSLFLRICHVGIDESSDDSQMILDGNGRVSLDGKDNVVRQSWNLDRRDAFPKTESITDGHAMPEHAMPEHAIPEHAIPDIDGGYAIPKVDGYDTSRTSLTTTPVDHPPVSADLELPVEMAGDSPLPESINIDDLVYDMVKTRSNVVALDSVTADVRASNVALDSVTADVVPDGTMMDRIPHAGVYISDTLPTNKLNHIQTSSPVISSSVSPSDSGTLDFADADPVCDVSIADLAMEDPRMSMKTNSEMTISPPVRSVSFLETDSDKENLQYLKLVFGVVTGILSTVIVGLIIVVVYLLIRKPPEQNVSQNDSGQNDSDQNKQQNTIQQDVIRRSIIPQEEESLKTSSGKEEVQKTTDHNFQTSVTNAVEVTQTAEGVNDVDITQTTDWGNPSLDDWSNWIPQEGEIPELGEDVQKLYSEMYKTLLNGTENTSYGAVTGTTGAENAGYGAVTAAQNLLSDRGILHSEGGILHSEGGTLHSEGSQSAMKYLGLMGGQYSGAIDKNAPFSGSVDKNAPLSAKPLSESSAITIGPASELSANGNSSAYSLFAFPEHSCTLVSGLGQGSIGSQRNISERAVSCTNTSATDIPNQDIALSVPNIEFLNSEGHPIDEIQRDDTFASLVSEVLIVSEANIVSSTMVSDAQNPDLQGPHNRREDYVVSQLGGPDDRDRRGPQPHGVHDRLGDADRLKDAKATIVSPTSQGAILSPKNWMGKEEPISSDLIGSSVFSSQEKRSTDAPSPEKKNMGTSPSPGAATAIPQVENTLTQGGSTIPQGESGSASAIVLPNRAPNPASITTYPSVTNSVASPPRIAPPLRQLGDSTVDSEINRTAHSTEGINGTRYSADGAYSKQASMLAEDMVELAMAHPDCAGEIITRQQRRIAELEEQHLQIEADTIKKMTVLMEERVHRVTQKVSTRLSQLSGSGGTGAPGSSGSQFGVTQTLSRGSQFGLAQTLSQGTQFGLAQTLSQGTQFGLTQTSPQSGHFGLAQTSSQGGLSASRSRRASIQTPNRAENRPSVKRPPVRQPSLGSRGSSGNLESMKRNTQKGFENGQNAQDGPGAQGGHSAQSVQAEQIGRGPNRAETMALLQSIELKTIPQVIDSRYGIGANNAGERTNVGSNSHGNLASDGPSFDPRNPLGAPSFDAPLDAASLSAPSFDLQKTQQSTVSNQLQGLVPSGLQQKSTGSAFAGLGPVLSQMQLSQEDHSTSIGKPANPSGKVLNTGGSSFTSLDSSPESSPYRTGFDARPEISPNTSEIVPEVFPNRETSPQPQRVLRSSRRLPSVFKVSGLLPTESVIKKKVSIAIARDSGETIIQPGDDHAETPRNLEEERGSTNSSRKGEHRNGEDQNAHQDRNAAANRRAAPILTLNESSIDSVIEAAMETSNNPNSAGQLRSTTTSDTFTESHLGSVRGDSQSLKVDSQSLCGSLSGKGDSLSGTSDTLKENQSFSTLDLETPRSPVGSSSNPAVSKPGKFLENVFGSNSMQTLGHQTPTHGSITIQLSHRSDRNSVGRTTFSLSRGVSDATGHSQISQQANVRSSNTLSRIPSSGVPGSGVSDSVSGKAILSLGAQPETTGESSSPEMRQDSIPRVVSTVSALHKESVLSAFHVNLGLSVDSQSGAMPCPTRKANQQTRLLSNTLPASGTLSGSSTSPANSAFKRSNGDENSMSTANNSTPVYHDSAAVYSAPANSSVPNNASSGHGTTLLSNDGSKSVSRLAQTNMSGGFQSGNQTQCGNQTEHGGQTAFFGDIVPTVVPHARSVLNPSICLTQTSLPQSVSGNRIIGFEVYEQKLSVRDKPVSRKQATLVLPKVSMARKKVITPPVDDGDGLDDLEK